MRTTCAVYGCESTSYSENSGELRFHQFPKDEKRCQIWIKACQRHDLKDKCSKSLKHLNICSIHFDKKMYANVNLKVTAVPTLNLPPANISISTQTDYPEASIDMETNDELIEDLLEDIEEEKTISADEWKEVCREIIYRVYNYLQFEYEMFKSANSKTDCDLTPLSDIKLRTAEATGITEQTVETIINMKGINNYCNLDDYLRLRKEPKMMSAQNAYNITPTTSNLSKSQTTSKTVKRKHKKAGSKTIHYLNPGKKSGTKQEKKDPKRADHNRITEENTEDCSIRKENRENPTNSAEPEEVLTLKCEVFEEPLTVSNPSGAVTSDTLPVQIKLEPPDHATEEAMYFEVPSLTVMPGSDETCLTSDTKQIEVKLEHDKEWETTDTDPSKVNIKKKERQRRYREQNRDKLRKREAERRRYIQRFRRIVTSTILNRKELHKEINDKSFTSQISIQNEQIKKKNAVKKIREYQKRYRERNREKLKQREAERRKRLQVQK